MGNAGQRGKKEEPEYVRANKRVEEAVPQHIEQWATAAGLPLTHQFQEIVTKALRAFMGWHIATPSRWRWSTARKAYLDLADDYDAIGKLLRHWESGRALPPVHHDPRFNQFRFNCLKQLKPEPPVLRAALAPFGNSANFKRLAKVAKEYATACAPDKGGGVSSAFDILSSGLLDAFEPTKEVPKSRFSRLVEVVWPVACEIAETETKRSVQSKPASSKALRKRLQRLLARRGKSS